ncbi:pyruvate carboxylase [Rubinisphaera sp.]|uniref:pyruvate carboxylase n=1 Tax=Rubinisphaera sp. TaxID=2024857 RepID=UPI000C10682E|nr:pyruvate carboxylase [Rubinisphaera sp.]MBV08885.1 pyruvate carboxylase [Rubinisphaera sp.]|tara:strand:+ start:4245 stop:7688 length:3444 start_codon:yes stop_codon:yes gene_type:complete
MKSIKKLLVANRSEIAIRIFRSATELGIRTVAIYSYEDRYALHRFKADEAYQIGREGEPIRTYLDIDSIIEQALECGADAIHPGYGFLSENPDLAKACEKAGIIFVGPSIDSLLQLGDKTTARQFAAKAGVPVLSGSGEAISSAEEGLRQANEQGFPIILKAAKGGGGRGMRVVKSADDFISAFESAQRESLSAFGSPDVFIENFIEQARHIEVQILGDQHGNLTHLYERDCSVQRRHQKVVEIAPAPNLTPEAREMLLSSALAIGKAVDYYAAGTVEFLLDVNTNNVYFIEVNPRIQVEHTVTEEVTGFDIVKAQILVSSGHKLTDPEIGLDPENPPKPNGFAIQCRITTEDPMNSFMPDYGRVSHYRSASGMGIRLDAGSAFSGAVVNPFYDSLLVKVTAHGRTFPETARRMLRCLQEFRIRGVKTNIPFLTKVVTNEVFLKGECTTRFIDNTPDLFNLPLRKNRATKLLSYIGETIVNGNPIVKDRPVAKRRSEAPVPKYNLTMPRPAGTRDKFLELGATGFSKWITSQQQLMFTDTTFRDAHQSLHATRFRTYDLLNIAEAYSYLCPNLFSLEMWGGATFDTSMRFLHECPWQRLADIREKVPNILTQMLLRASNAVGYTNYPDNVVTAFVKEAAQTGMDVFRVFDALNWVPNMKLAMDAVIESGMICEASICYTGDISDPKKTKYDLKYYVNLAKQLENMGAHILAIKDMAGLCKPDSATLLVKTLKQEIGIPIHFHTHDTAGIQAASIFNAAAEQLDIADAAMAPMSGGTSQPNLNTIVGALQFSDRKPDLNRDALDDIATYWRAVREYYAPFESAVLPSTSDLYRHEMPGGQYTNLFAQAQALGLSDRWSDVCDIYATVNELFGDIVKVTPTSKAVGDMALFMVANDLTAEDIMDTSRELAFPASVIDLIGGMMGQPPGGFPEKIRQIVLKDKPGLTDRPGASLPPANMENAKAEVKKLLGREPENREVLSYLLYPKVYADFAKHQETYSDVSTLPTPVFFYGQDAGEEFAVEIEKGKTLIIKYLTKSQPHTDGTRTVFFELNGQPRDVTIADKSLEGDALQSVKADPNDPKQIGASMPGMVVTIAVKPGDKIKKGQKLFSLEAMKMESTINAEVPGTVASVHIKAGSQVNTGDLVITFE